jgi:hypothetical protein
VRAVAVEGLLARVEDGAGRGDPRGVAGLVLRLELGLPVGEDLGRPRVEGDDAGVDACLVVVGGARAGGEGELRDVAGQVRVPPEHLRCLVVVADDEQMATAAAQRWTAREETARRVASRRISISS